MKESEKDFIKVTAKYLPTDQWFCPADCKKIASIRLDGKKVKFKMIKAFEILENTEEEPKEIEMLYEIKKLDKK